MAANGDILKDGIEEVGSFVGQFQHMLDPKKRLTIPSDWRAIVGKPERLFVLPAIGGNHLYVWPWRVMKPRMERLQQLSMADRRERDFLRYLGSRSELLPWDAQGRMRIRDELLAYAGLTDQVVLVGNLEAFELWSPKNWAEVERRFVDEDLLESAKRLGM